MISSICAIALRGDNIHLTGIEGSYQLIMAGKTDDLRLYMVRGQVFLQHTDDGAVQHADPAAIQGLRLRCDVNIRIMPDKIIGFIAHGAFRIGNYMGSLLPPGKSRQQIESTVKKHLIQIRKIAVHVFILPARVFRELAVVLVGIAGLDRAFLRALLKDLVFVIPNADGLGFCVGKGCWRQQ